METIMQYIIAGFTVGSVYAMIAVGFTIIYSATEIINFAQGEFVMLGGMVAVMLTKSLHLPMVAVFPMTVAIVGLTALLCQRSALYPLRNASTFGKIIITIGLAIILRGSAMLLWGKDSHSLPPFTGDEPIPILGATILPQSIWVIATCVLTMVGLSLFFRCTLVGKAMRACAADKVGSALCGINAPQMAFYCFGLSGAIGAATGIIIDPITLASYDMGVMLGVKGFCGAIIGGLNSFPGAIIGGFLLGIVESLGAGFISSQYKDAIALVILLIILFVRPSGLLGRVTES